MSETTMRRAVATSPRRMIIGGLTALIALGGAVSMAVAPASHTPAPTPTRAATTAIGDNQVTNYHVLLDRQILNTGKQSVDL